MNTEFDTYFHNLHNLGSNEILSIYRKAIKSNSIKTILLHFIDFMRTTGDEVVIEALAQSHQSQERSITQIRKEFLSFIKTKKFNQQTFLAIYNSLRFTFHFEYYLRYYFLDTINLQNLKECESHLICLVFFQRCYSQKFLISFIKTYKKKHQTLNAS